MFGRNGDGAFAAYGLLGVGQDVHEHLVDLVGVALNPRKVAVVFHDGDPVLQFVV